MNINSLVSFLSIIIISLTACGNSNSKALAKSYAPHIDDTAVTDITPIEEEHVGDASKASHIVISKQTMTLKLYDTDNRLICSFPVATGKNPGNKRRRGDMKTPEGEFTIQQIQPAAEWTHDFGDGKGVIKGCYGNWFIRLATLPHTGIGIHGTHAPESIGTRATEGCVRLNNNDLDSLKPMVKVGMVVIIEAGEADILEDERLNGRAITENKPIIAEKPQYAVAVITEESTTEGAVEGVASEKHIAAPAEGEVWHTVVDGDLVGAIAIKYGTSTSRIKELNPDINVDRISIGQRIRVK